MGFVGVCVCVCVIVISTSVSIYIINICGSSTCKMLSGNRLFSYLNFNLIYVLIYMFILVYID